MKNLSITLGALAGLFLLEKVFLLSPFIHIYPTILGYVAIMFVFYVCGITSKKIVGIVSFMTLLVCLNKLPYTNLIFTREVIMIIGAGLLVAVYRLSSRFLLLAGMVSLLSAFALHFIHSDSFADEIAFVAYGALILSVVRYFTEQKVTFGTFSLPSLPFRKVKKLLPYIVLAIIAYIPRAWLATHFYGTMDTSVHIQLVFSYLSGHNPYSDANYAYPPLWLAMLVGLQYISWFTQASFVFLSKLPSILSDVGITLLIFSFFSRPKKQSSAFLWALLYALNPVAVLVSGFHGQIDSIWIFCSLVAWTLFEKNKKLSSAWALSAGIALKVFPVIFLPLFLKRLPTWKEKILFTFIALMPLSVSMIVPFMLSYREVMNNFVNYGIELNFWGTSFISAYLYQLYPTLLPVRAVFKILHSAQIDRIFLYGSLLLAYGWVFLRSRKTLIQEMLIIMLVFLIMLPFISIQWWIWFVPFAILGGLSLKKIMTYSIVMGYVLAVRYYLYQANIPEYFRPISVIHDTFWGMKLDAINLYLALGIWVLLIWWLYKEIKAT